MSEKYAITQQGRWNVAFRHANGSDYTGELSGCGEAFVIRNSDGEEISTVPTTVNNEITPDILRLASNVIETIDANKARMVEAEQESLAVPQIDPMALLILRQRLKEYLNGLYGPIGQRDSGTTVNIGELHVHLHIHV